MGELIITGGNVVTPQGILANGAITVKDGIIQSIDASAGAAQVPGTDDRVIDAQDLYVLPGLISLQCSFLDKEIFPRTGVEFPIERALIQADKVMASSGIVEAYHTVRISESAGLSLKGAGAMNSSQNKAGLFCAHRLHLIADESTLPMTRTFHHSGHILSLLPSHGKVDGKALEASFYSVRKSQSELGAKNPSASAIPEFSAVFEPIGALSFQEAKSSGALVVAKVPYLVASSPDPLARDAFREGLIDICVADCYAPSLLYAAFLLDRLGMMPLYMAVNLASLAPARVLGIAGTEGSLEVSKTANLCMVSLWEGIPRVVKTLIRGKVVFSTERETS